MSAFTFRNTILRSLPPLSRRVGPVGACWQGDSNPVSLTAVVIERDRGDPKAFQVNEAR